MTQTQFFPVGYGPPLLKLGEVMVIDSSSDKLIKPPHAVQIEKNIQRMIKYDPPKKEMNVCSFVKTDVWATNSNAGDT